MRKLMLSIVLVVILASCDSPSARRNSGMTSHLLPKGYTELLLVNRVALDQWPFYTVSDSTNVLIPVYEDMHGKYYYKRERVGSIYVAKTVYCNTDSLVHYDINVK